MRENKKSHGGHQKKREGATLLSFKSTLVLQSSTCTSVCREFSYHSCITMWGLYTKEPGLYIPMMSLLKRALGLHEQASWMNPHQFHWRAFIHLQVYAHPLHGNPYSSHHIYHKAFSRQMVVLIGVSLSHFLTSYPHHFSLCHPKFHLSCLRSFIA